MPHPDQQPTFLPLTVAVTKSAAARPEPPEQAGSPERAGAAAVWERAVRVNTAANGCWVALLGGCESPERKTLPSALRALAEAASAYAGATWWHGHGSGHRRRVSEAQSRINDAVRDGDGAEFAEAFVGYDQAMAAVVATVSSKLEIPAP